MWAIKIGAFIQNAYISLLIFTLGYVSVSPFLSSFSFLQVYDTVMCYVIPSRPAVRRLRRCAIQRDTHARLWHRSLDIMINS